MKEAMNPCIPGVRNCIPGLNIPGIGGTGNCIPGSGIPGIDAHCIPGSTIPGMDVHSIPGMPGIDSSIPSFSPSLP